MHNNSLSYEQLTVDFLMSSFFLAVDLEKGMYFDTYSNIFQKMCAILIVL